MTYLLVPLCLCLAAVFLLQESKKRYVPAVVLKGLASACFVILGFLLSGGYLALLVPPLRLQGNGDSEVI